MNAASIAARMIGSVTGIGAPMCLPAPGIRSSGR